MFSKRSGYSPHNVMDDTNQVLQQNTELSTQEILEALDILDRVNNSKNEDYINDLSEKEVNKHTKVYYRKLLSKGYICFFTKY